MIQMRFTWKGNWKRGEIIIEAETLEELNSVLDKLSPGGESEIATPTEGGTYPTISGGLGCSDAIRALLKTDWGKEPRSMAEIEKALQTNALYFSKGGLSGTLTMMTKGGQLRRFKKAGNWVYVLK